ncbi:MAG: 2-oxoacid:acceptor oxidoreductase subunit alpha [Peptococcaceae bacterium]|nr:2-oxoacid:acceptor oxidoreductase subunit alpha [Peptococcaceae bacterium]
MNIVIGGAAGQGMDTIAHLLGKTLTRLGYGVLLSKDYMSRVRGGHNFSLLRIGSTTPWAQATDIDILVALNEETYAVHHQKLRSGASVIFDNALFALPAQEPRGLPTPFGSLARAAGGAILASTVATGAVLSLLGLALPTAEGLIREMFAEGLVEQNIAALRAGYAALLPARPVTCALPKATPLPPQIFIDGNQALGMAALASGCRFLAAYPMTPATGVMTYLAARQQQHGLVVEQAEDEIAAINMVLGASYAGLRSMTCTSGGGFALMVEGLSLAGMTETPIVVVLAMRPGPATGLPTRTEQGDLNFAIFGGHGEFPRAVLSATNLEDAFYRLNKAFNLADKYQVPVIFLTDQNFADTARSIRPYDFSRLVYERHLATEETATFPYQRYRLTEDGLSPRAYPGQFIGEVVLSDSDEHDEDGHIIEDGAMRKRMMDKRMLKQNALATEMSEPELYGSTRAEILLIGWGSTYGAMREAVDTLNVRGKNAAMLHFSDLWPLPLNNVTTLLPQARHSFCIEGNATGQFAALLRRESGLQTTYLLLKYDGRPWSGEEIAREVEKNV